MPQRRPLDDRRERGISLVETLTAIAITAIVAGMAVPSLQQSVARQRVEGRTAELVADLAQARIEALTRNEYVRLSFQADSGGACYVLHTGPIGDCICNPMTATHCKSGAIEVKTVMFPSAQSIVLEPPKPKHAITFTPSRGAASPYSSIKLSAATGATLSVKVASTGRATVCASGEMTFPGHEKCK